MSKNNRFSEIQKTLIARWKPAWSADNSLSPLVHGFGKAMSSVATLMAKKEEMRAEGKFSEQGLRDEIREIGRRETVPAFRAAATSIERAQASLKEARAALSLQKVDPANASEAQLRGEIRTWLRSLPQTQAIQTLMSEGVDEKMVQAALEGPPALSGLTEQMRGMVEKRTLELKYGPELAVLQDKADAVEVAKSAFEIAIYQFREEGGFAQGADFDNWMKETTAEIERAEASKSVEIDLRPDPAAMDFVAAAIDEAFAKAFPAIYPNHPVNRKAA